MSERAEQLASQFERANEELIATIADCNDEEWQRKTVAEWWTIGVATCHIAEDHQLISGWVRSIASGVSLPPFAPEFVNEYNAHMAERNAGLDKAEAIARLRSGVAEAAAIVRSLGDAELEMCASIFGRSMRTAEVIEHVLIGHVYEHGASIRATLAATPLQVAN